VQGANEDMNMTSRVPLRSRSGRLCNVHCSMKVSGKKD
jgi:hypothetical protein